MKLTEPQKNVLLNSMKYGPSSAYRLGVSLNTLNALNLKGLIRLVESLGNIAFPRNAIWNITEKGKEHG